MHPDPLHTFLLCFSCPTTTTQNTTPKKHTTKLHDFEHAMLLAQQEAKHRLIGMLLLKEPEVLNRQISLPNA